MQVFRGALTAAHISTIVKLAEFYGKVHGLAAYLELGDLLNSVNRFVVIPEAKPEPTNGAVEQTETEAPAKPKKAKEAT